MDNVRGTLLRSVDDQLSQIFDQHNIVLGGDQASKDNVEILRRCLKDWLVLLEDLMLRLGLDDASRVARRMNFLQAITRSDITEVLLFLDAIYHRLIEVDDETPETFKQFLESHAHESIDYMRLLSPINQALYPFLSETDQEKKAYFLSIIAQFLRFARKLEFQDIGLEAKAFADYMDTEKELEAMQYDDEKVFKDLSDIIQRWLGDFHIDCLLPKHGSGSVAEGSLSLAEKYKVMSVDQLIKIGLRNPSYPDSWMEYFPSQPGSNLVRCSRTIFVPKTATKLRTISMEPTTLQYLQQGVMYELYRYIGNHPYLGVRIKLSDQGQNQVLAWEGSRYHNYGTIDLSHASDSVSWNLVRKIFKSSPSLYKWLLITRSKMTLLPNGETIALQKFAPMGSALCFPIECLIFAAIVEYATDNVCKSNKVPKELYSIYGDDIVVQSNCYDEVIRILTICGFTVNMTKSYNSGNYRESCGKEYYAGYDISAITYRIPFYRKRVTPSAYWSLCSAANNAVGRFPLYRAWLIKLTMSLSPRHGPYFTFNKGKSPYLFSSQPTNFHVKSRWNKNYQRWEGKFISVKSKQRCQDELDDDILRYHIKLIELAKRSTERVTNIDESTGPRAVHGLVEYFCSTSLPLTDWREHDLLLAFDW